MRYFKKFLLIFSIIFFYHNIVLADTPYFLDFKLILNESEAGKKAQKYLKNKLENGIKNLKSKEKKLLTIIIPRHIHRSKSIINELKKINLKIASHSTTRSLASNTDIYLVDTFGETSKFYNLTNVSFIGGSFIKHGGQNPLEAVRLGNYIVSGKNVDNFKEIYSFLKQNKISFFANDKKGIEKIVKQKINKKLPNIFKNRIYNNGIKILNKNVFYINKFIK